MKIKYNMGQYISKSAVVAEIEKLKKLLPWGSCASQISMECNCKNEAYNNVLKSIDTLEVKEVGVDLGDPKGDKSAKYIIDTKTLEVKEVDLEKEIDDYTKNISAYNVQFGPFTNLYKCAKYFFELGINAQQKISYVPNIDDILKKEGLDPDSKEAKIFKESYYTAMEKLKAQKGE